MANGLLNIVFFPLALYSDLRTFEASMRGIDLKTPPFLMTPPTWRILVHRT